MKKESIMKDDEISKMKKEIRSLKAENADLIKKIDNDVKIKTEPNDQNNFDLDIIDYTEIDKLNKVKKVGMGGQSEVFEVTRQQHLALKILYIENFSTGTTTNSESIKKLKRLLQEYEFLRLLNHPNIIRALGFCYGDEEHPPSILLEFCPKNLDEALSNMTSSEKVCCIVEIILGMEAVHASNIIHRDLKPKNILIDQNGHVKISDFGISCYVEIEDQSKTTGVGTMKFMAPEILKEKKDYNNKVDVYLFGVVLFFILTGNLPKISVVDQGNGIKAEIPKTVNKVSKSLINSCWSFDADERPSFTEIMDIVKRNNFRLIDGIESEIDYIKNFLSL